jgi:hypothetical protein
MSIPFGENRNPEVGPEQPWNWQREKYQLRRFLDIVPRVKIYKAMSMAPGMDQSEIDAFLAGSKTPLRLGTTNSKGEPNIHPVWYHYGTNKLYLMSYKDAVKVRNLRHNKTISRWIPTRCLTGE